MVARARKQTGFYQVDDFSMKPTKGGKGGARKKRSALNPDLSQEDDMAVEMSEEEEEAEVPPAESKMEDSSDDEEMFTKPKPKSKRKPAEKMSVSVTESEGNAVDETNMSVVVSPGNAEYIDDKGNNYFGTFYPSSLFSKSLHHYKYNNI
jgi:hypothetical protein